MTNTGKIAIVSAGMFPDNPPACVLMKSARDTSGTTTNSADRARPAFMKRVISILSRHCLWDAPIGERRSGAHPMYRVKLIRGGASERIVSPCGKRHAERKAIVV